MTSDISLTFSGDMVLLARVAEAGSISAACRQVGLERTTISRRLSRLESRLGADLLNRSNREVTLTEAGVLYYQFCQKVVEAVEEGFFELTNVNVASEKLVRIELAVPDAAYFISMISGTADSERTEYCLGDPTIAMADKDSDLSIQFQFQSATSTDTVIRLGTVPQSLWIGSRCVAASDGEIRLSNLQDIPFIYAAQQSLDRDLTVGRRGELRVVPIGSKFRVSTLEQCRESCLMGNGAVLLPDYLCERFVERDELRKIEPGWAVGAATLVAVHAHNRFLGKSARLHLDHLRNQIGGLQHH